MGGCGDGRCGGEGEREGVVTEGVSREREWEGVVTLGVVEKGSGSVVLEGGGEWKLESAVRNLDTEGKQK